MMPRWHFFFGLLASFVLYLSGFNLIHISIFFLASFLIIDLDHVPRFIFKEKSINPFKFYSWSLTKKNAWRGLSIAQKRSYKRPIFFFHNLETLLLLLLLSSLLPILYFVLAGFLFHLVTDLIYQHFQKEEKHYKISLIYTLVINRTKKPYSA
jgi:hypothetical protein